MTFISPTGTSGVAPAGPARTDAAKANLDYSAFLRLFIASMKNQDPTKPNDPSQTLSQLAAFSNVEQSIKFNEKLDRLIASSSATLAASLIGKDLSSLDNAVSGVVTGVENGSAGLLAILEGGARLDLTLGYKIAGS